MIAAFWDDLAGGDVYTWHDTANHRYIVQWDDFGTYSGSYTGNCTFEIILYDPAHHATDTGDGRIEMMYQAVTVNADETTYFTVGIQNEARDVGLTYVYGNNYAGGAATIQAGRAIRLLPVVPQAQGTLSGEITNASGGGDAVEGAVVTVLGNGRTLASGADGIYAGGVPIGTYDVAVWHDSFAADTLYNVAIAEGVIADGRLQPRRHPRTLHRQHDPAGRHRGHRRPVRGGSQHHRPDRRGDATSWHYTSSATGGPHVLPLSLIDAGTGLVRGEIPGQPEGTRVQYWITASDVLGNASAAPDGAPWPAYSFMVSGVTQVADDNCETAGSWVVDPQGNDTATSGIWEHGDPIGTVESTAGAARGRPHPGAGRELLVHGPASVGRVVGLQRRRRRRHHPRLARLQRGRPGHRLGELLALVHQRPGQQPGRGSLAGAGLQRRRRDLGHRGEHHGSSNAWQQVSFVLNDLVASPTSMKLRFQASDDATGSLVEAAVDDLTIAAGTSVADLLAPTVSVQSPSGGTYANGMTLGVAWNAGDDVGVVHARVWLSLDGGASYDLLMGEGPFDGNLDWTVNVPADRLGSYSARCGSRCSMGMERLASDDVRRLHHRARHHGRGGVAQGPGPGAEPPQPVQPPDRDQLQPAAGAGRPGQAGADPGARPPRGGRARGHLAGT